MKNLSNNWARTLFAILLWFAATFFFLGDTGKLGDDYTVAMRDPATGALNLASHPWARWPYFWRPLHLAHASFINTISWDHPWIGHLELALIHALVAWMLGGLLARLGIPRRIAFAAALLFLVCPLIAGAVLWTTTSCNAVSAVFLLRVLELVRRQAVGPSTTIRTLWIALLSFLTACWYEPAAAALAAVPLIYFAAADPRRELIRARAAAALRCTVAAGLSVALYAALLILTAPAKARGGAQSFITIASALPRARSFCSDIAEALAGARAADILLGSMHQGWHTLHSPMGYALVGLALVLTPLTAASMLARPAQPSQASHPTRLTLVAFSGAAVFLAAWLPIAAVPTQGVALRSLYIPVIGLAVFAAALASGAAHALASALTAVRRTIGILSTTAIIALALAGTVGMIGLQTQLRLNSLHDALAVQELRRLVPNPDPDTVFLPLRIEQPPANTDDYCHEYAIHSAFEAPWTCAAIVQIGYQRADLAAAPTPRSLRSLAPKGFRRVQDPTLTPWDRCIPFTLDSRGAVHVFRTLAVIPSAGTPFNVECPRSPTTPAASEPVIRLRETIGGQCVAE